MATSSIHIQSGGNGYFAHNSRESKTVNAIFDDEQNFCSCTNAQAFETYKKELSSRTNAYLENNPTRKKLHEKTITHLSAIVNFNKEHTPDDIKKVCDYLEKTFDTKVIQFAMHRDEGHINESGEKVKNYHAHIEFMGLDSKGNSVRRKLDKKSLIELQSQTAKLLKMERGKNYTELQEKRPKRLDTYEFKKAKEMEAEKIKDLLATKEQLKTANNQLREFMKENQALRTDYAPLEAEKKLLEEKLKAKVLTEKELLTKFQELEKKFVDSKNQNKSLEEQKEVLANKVTTLEQKIVSVPNMSDLNIQKELQNIVNEEIEVKNVKTGIFTTEKAPVLKDSKSFFKKIQDLTVQGTAKIKQEFQTLKNKYNDLLEVLKTKDKEIDSLKAKVRELESEAPKQIEKRNEKALEKLVENAEVKETKERSSNSSLENFKQIQKQLKTEIIEVQQPTSREKFEASREAIRKQMKEEEKEEKSSTKKRGYSYSR